MIKYTANLELLKIPEKLLFTYNGLRICSVWEFETVSLPHDSKTTKKR